MECSFIEPTNHYIVNGTKGLDRPGSGSSGPGEKGRKSGADHPGKAHPLLLRGGGGGRRPG